jgi:transcriptional regulator NrdR family protein
MEKASTLPVWIYKRDGRLVPFEADKISQSLFAAGETLGKTDAFTAHELTDSVLHFLSAELNGAIPRTSQVSEMVFKVVRELGQTAIAQAYADFSSSRAQGQLSGLELKVIQSKRKSAEPEGWPELPPPADLVAVDPNSLLRRAAAISLGDYSLREIFTRDIAAAHKEGLITLSGLATPFEMQGGLLPRMQPDQIASTLEETRRSFGQFVALDGPEFSGKAPVAHPSGLPPAAIGVNWIRDLSIWLRATGLHAVVNLNTGTPPPWARGLATGPLFDPATSSSSPEHWSTQADEILSLLCSSGNEGVQIHWHLSGSDWQSKDKSRMGRLARYLIQGAPITIVFDRPNGPISLAEGLDRRYSGLLNTVGIHLPRLARQLGERCTPELFLQKLGSLARLAITAAIQKRRFLTRYHRNRTAFLVDRARLAVVPVGLEFVARNFAGQSILPGTPAAELASRIVQNLHDTLRDEGPRYNLEISLDSVPTPLTMPIIGGLSPFDFASGSRSLNENEKNTTDFSAAKRKPTELATSLDKIAGLTIWNDVITPRQQIQAAGLLHEITKTGTAWVQLPDDGSRSEEPVLDVLRFAWKETQVHRIRFGNIHPGRRQLTAPWENG